LWSVCRLIRTGSLTILAARTGRPGRGARLFRVGHITVSATTATGHPSALTEVDHRGLELDLVGLERQHLGVDLALRAIRCSVGWCRAWRTVTDATQSVLLGILRSRLGVGRLRPEHRDESAQPDDPEEPGESAQDADLRVTRGRRLRDRRGVGR
jgi:hypothetical protein